MGIILKFKDKPLPAHHFGVPSTSSFGVPRSRSKWKVETGKNIGHHLHLGPRERAGPDKQLTVRTMALDLRREFSIFELLSQDKLQILGVLGLTGLEFKQNIPRVN
jgi:hypothetical protein